LAEEKSGWFNQGNISPGAGLAALEIPGITVLKYYRTCRYKPVQLSVWLLKEEKDI
jgi:hypothetical protein